MNKKIKYVLITMGIIIIILMLTNPSLDQFKEHIGDPKEDPYVLVFNKESNWLIFSTYKVTYKTTFEEKRYRDYSQEANLDKLAGKYTGIFMNFYKWEWY